MWMSDALMGYHQLAVEKSSQEKLAFQGVDAIKWTYTVMPFGPTNGPATFINFIRDIDSVWKDNAKKQGITISNNTNTKIIVDYIVSWAEKPPSRSRMHAMPVEGLPSIQSFVEPTQKLFLCKTAQICWHGCVRRR
jgi:hypothetical protein